MRVGPGFDYRINWIYKRKGLPVKVLRVMGGWSLVEDPDGTRGWILGRFIGRARTGIVKPGITELHAAADPSSPVQWRLQPGVVGKLDDCNGEWCRFRLDEREGFVRRDTVWGAREL
jgi:SH3-like domain-containing protein